MAKRRLISQLPSHNQTNDLRSFFGSTVDQVFQPGDSQPISGYIGRRTSFVDPYDFYVGEPDSERAAYQLENGMVSYNTSINALTDALTYPDFVGYLQTNGANVSDQQRLFETEFYTFAPPINLDMLINHRNYYWFGDETGAIDLPVLLLTVPVTNAIGDGATTSYPLPASIHAVAIDDETPTVYVNGLAVEFKIVGDIVILTTAPDFDAVILIARVPDLATSIRDRVTVDVSDLNVHGVTTLSSGMRIKILDALAIIDVWDYLPWDTNHWDINPVYMVDGIGQSLRLTADADLLRDIEPQYVTIDRSSLDGNLWSLHNLWVHKDTFAWANATFVKPITERQATRPIIEFIRDIILYDDQVWSESADPLFMLYDLDNVALNEPNRYPESNFDGNRIFGFASGNSNDPVLRRKDGLKIDSNGYIIYDNATTAMIDGPQGMTHRYSYKGGTIPITGIYDYATLG